MVTLNLEKIMDITRYGTMNKLLHVTGFVLKAVEIWKVRTKQSTREKLVVAEALTAADLLKAEEVRVKTIQLLFPDEIKLLRKGSNTTITQSLTG